MNPLQRNLGDINERIAAALERSGRGGESVTLVAVTKTVPAEVVAAAWQLGVRHFGENRVEEGAPKIGQVARLIGSAGRGEAFGAEGSLRNESLLPNASPLQGNVPTWHMIGHIQSRKAKEVAEAFDFVHSVDRSKLVGELQKRADAADRMLPCLIEINTSGEASKTGAPGSAGPGSRSEAEAILALARELAAAPNLRAEGLMTMGPLGGSPSEIRRCFALLRQWREFLQKRAPEADWRHLSMGMTDDFEIGLEEGATIVRIGRGIFHGTFETTDEHG